MIVTASWNVLINFSSKNERFYHSFKILKTIVVIKPINWVDLAGTILQKNI